MGKKKFSELCTDLVDVEGEGTENYVKNVLKGLGNANKSQLNETEQTAISVASLLLPLIEQLISKSKPTQKLESAVRVNAYKVDSLEQYTRKENLRISGIKELAGENLKAKVVDIAKAMGVAMEERDINVVHRLGKVGGVGVGGVPASGIRNIIVRFVSRDIRHQFLVNKKSLQSNAEYKSIFINEDLTPLRQKLFYKLRKCDKVDNCYVRDGNIKCHLKDGSECTVSSPDDLFKVGFNNVDYEELKISYLDF